MIQPSRYLKSFLACNLVFWFRGILWCVLPVLFASLEEAAASDAKPHDSSRFGSIVIATPVWENQTNSDGTGLFFDILKAIYEPPGISLQINLVPTKRAILLLKKKEIDASLGFFSAEVGKLIGWDFYQTPKHPIVTERFVAIFKKDRTRQWRYPDSLRNARVAWIAGYDLDNRIAVSLQYQKVTSQDQAWNLLKADRVDYYIDSESDSMSAARNRGVDLNDFHVQGIWADNMYAAFAQTERGGYFMAVFDQRMKVLRRSGELARIYAKWGASLPPAE